jgi:hypothetical protein
VPPIAIDEPPEEVPAAPARELEPEAFALGPNAIANDPAFVDAPIAIPLVFTAVAPLPIATALAPVAEGAVGLLGFSA